MSKGPAWKTDAEIRAGIIAKCKKAPAIVNTPQQAWEAWNAYHRYRGMADNAREGRRADARCCLDGRADEGRSERDV